MSKKTTATSEQPEPAGTAVDLSNLKRPPVIERFVDLQVDLKPSHFEKFTPSWLAEVAKEHGYPGQLVKKFWQFKIEGKDVPEPVGTLYEILRIEKRTNAGKLVKAIEVVPAIEGAIPRLRFVQGRPTKTVSRFSELEGEIRATLPPFIAATKITGVMGMWLSYRNELSADRYPEALENDSLMLGRFLELFRNNEGIAGTYISPIRFHFTSEVEGMKGRTMRFRLENDLDTKNLSLQIFLEYNGLHHGDTQDVESVIAELEQAHGLILDAFRRHFTTEALEIFAR